jgi:hypothetical protein
MKDKFIEIFSGLSIAYGKFIPEDKNDAGKLQGKNQIIREPGGLPEHLWEDHLSGKTSLGIIPIDENNSCRWGCIDIDIYNGFSHIDLIKKIRKHGLPLIVFRSKSGGAHVFMFFTVPVKAGLVQSKLKEFASFLGCAGSEIFPKQTKLLLDRGQTGNYLNLPYFNSEDSQRYALDDDGNPCSIEQFYTLYDIYAQEGAEKEYLKLDDFFADGPPCLNTLHSNGIPEGGRNETMTNIAVYYQKSGEKKIKLKLLTVNEDICDPPLDEKEIDIIVNSITKKEYDYGCSKEPLASNCNKKECYKRKYGKGKVDLEITPAGLERFGVEPPIWFMTLDGGTTLELTTDDLQLQTRFQKACIEQLKIMPGTIPAPRWAEKINALLGESTDSPGITGTSNTEIFIDYLKEWCTNKGAAETKEEISLGKPWLNREANTNRKHHFLLKDLEDFLQKKKFNAFNRTKITFVLKDKVKGEKISLRMNSFGDKDKIIKVWTIPEFVDEMEDIETVIPDMKDKKEYEA